MDEDRSRPVLPLASALPVASAPPVTPEAERHHGYAQLGRQQAGGRPHDQRAVRPPARQVSLRRHNLALLLQEVAGAGPLSRAELSRRTGLTKASVSTMVDCLTACGALEDVSGDGGARSGPGRPGAPIGLGRAGPVAVGVEVAVDYTSACAVDLAGHAGEEVVFAVDNRELGPDEGMRKAALAAAEVAARACRGGRRLLGCGLAVPGVVGPSGELWWAPNIAGWVGLHPGPALDDLANRRLGVPVGAKPRPMAVMVVGNEANLGAMAELWYGERRGERDFLRISGEIGVGAGVVVHGELLAGARGAAGELGHVNVEPDGPLCSCGARGCLEQYAGQEALLAAAGAPDCAALVEMASAGHPGALDALGAAGRALGLAVSATLNVVDVPAVVLGGIYADLAPWIEGPLGAELARRVVGSRFRPVEVRVAAVGREAAMRGAAGAVVHQAMADPAAFMPELLEPMD